MEGNEANNNNANSNQNAQNTTGQNNNANQPNNNSNGIDYNKIQEIIEGRNAKTEDSVLKAYFQKQGLSPEEMESAINAFKTQKANQANAQNKELTDTQASLQKVQLENQRLKSQNSLNFNARSGVACRKTANIIKNETMITRIEKRLSNLKG